MKCLLAADRRHRELAGHHADPAGRRRAFGEALEVLGPRQRTHDPRARLAGHPADGRLDETGLIDRIGRGGRTRRRSPFPSGLRATRSPSPRGGSGPCRRTAARAAWRSGLASASARSATPARASPRPSPLSAGSSVAKPVSVFAAFGPNAYTASLDMKNTRPREIADARYDLFRRPFRSPDAVRADRHRHLAEDLGAIGRRPDDEERAGFRADVELAVGEHRRCLLQRPELLAPAAPCRVSRS